MLVLLLVSGIDARKMRQLKQEESSPQDDIPSYSTLAHAEGELGKFGGDGEKWGMGWASVSTGYPLRPYRPSLAGQTQHWVLGKKAFGQGSASGMAPMSVCACWLAAPKRSIGSG